MTSSHDKSANHASRSQPSASVAHPHADMQANVTDSIATSASAATDKNNNASTPTSSKHAAATQRALLIATLQASKKLYTDHEAEADQVTATPALRSSVTATPSPPMSRAVSAGTQGSVVSPATSATSSARTSSPITWANWDEHIKHGKEAHNNRACLYSKTRQMMCQTTNLTRITSSRGFDRGYAPTKVTTPRLTKRRYSIDVLTHGWDKISGSMDWEDPQIAGAASILSKHHETDMVPRRTVPEPLPLPNPYRYQLFQLRAAWSPPENNGHYLTFQDSSLQNNEYWYMEVMSGLTAWMDDSPFNMSLETLRESFNCHDHSIDVVTSNVTQTIFMACITNELGHPSYNYLRERFSDKHWIFVPINDGLDGEYSSDARGTHWSLVAINRVQGEAHYYDSIKSSSRILNFASTVTHAVLHLIGSASPPFQLFKEDHTPNQFEQNLGSKDDGACGPFVWRMTSLLIERIIKDPYCHLTIAPQFYNMHWRMFNSGLIRSEMRRLIIRFKTLLDSMELAIPHDILAVEGEDVILCHRPPPMHWPRLRQQSPESQGRVVSDSEATSVDDDDVTLDGNESDTWQLVTVQPAVTSGPAANVDPDDDDKPAHDICLDDGPSTQHSHKRSHDETMSQASDLGNNDDRETATGPPPRKKQSPRQRKNEDDQVPAIRRQNSVESEEWSA